MTVHFPPLSSRWLNCLLLFILLCPTACRKPHPPSFILITLDTLRRDALGCYGNPDVYTPLLNKLSKSGTTLVNGFVSIPITNPSHATILSGCYPDTHGAVTYGRMVNQEVTTLAEILGRAGYHTGAFISGFSLVSHVSGLQTGFNLYDDEWSQGNAAERSASDTVDAALRWLKTHRKPGYFLWLHLFDPHKPYQPPRLYGRIYQPEYQPLAQNDNEGALLKKWEPEDTRPQTYSNTPDIDSHIARYWAEISYADAQCERFLNTIADWPEFQYPHLMLTSDHGESFSHNYFFRHMDRLYESLLAVPAIFHGPAFQSHLLVRGIVESIDLAPTMLDILGFDPPAVCDGQSRVSMLNGINTTHSQYAFGQCPGRNSEWSVGALRSVRDPEWKLIRHARNKSVELYHLAEDAGEYTDCRLEYPNQVARLVDVLENKSLPDQIDDDQFTDSMDEETKEKFRRLGYIQ